MADQTVEAVSGGKVEECLARAVIWRGEGCVCVWWGRGGRGVCVWAWGVCMCVCVEVCAHVWGVCAYIVSAHMSTY